MKVVVLGATGGTGREIIKQAVERGHEVTAFVRSPDRLGAMAEKITVKQGNLLDSGELERALLGQDAVLSAFGPRVPIAKEEHHLLRDFATALTPALRNAGVRRVVVESTAFLFRDAVFPPAYLAGKLFFPSVVVDADEMETIFRGPSSLDWTLVRPPRLTDRPHTGKYRIREEHLPLFGFSISRADVADCFLRVLENRDYFRKVLGVSV